MEISTIDISKVGLNVREPSLEAFQELAPLFRESFSKIGFAYISNHGIDQTFIDGAFKASKSFFELPQEVKEKSVKTTLAERGYVRPGQEIFDAKEDWTQVGHLINRVVKYSWIFNDFFLRHQLKYVRVLMWIFLRDPRHFFQMKMLHSFVRQFPTWQPRPSSSAREFLKSWHCHLTW